MKRITAFIICSALVFSLAACGNKGADDSKDGEKPGDTMTLEEIMEEIEKDVTDLPAVEAFEVNEDNFENYLFIDYIKGAEAIASESLINTNAHSVVLLRLPNGEDASSVAKDIEDNADSNKWICVFAEKTIVKVHGNTIVLIMSYEDIAGEIADNFDALWA